MVFNYKKNLGLLLVAVLIFASISLSSYYIQNEDEYVFAQPENDVSAVAMGVPLIWNNPHFGGGILGLTGAGQVVGVVDTGLDLGDINNLHTDLRGRIMGVKDYSGVGWDDPFGHGTHIAGTIVGTGHQSGGRLKGLAPDAMLYFQATYDKVSKSLKLPPMHIMLKDAYDQGVRVHSNSWGIKEGSGTYDHNAQSLDKFVWEHPDMVVLKSAGNFAPGQSPYVTSPGPAKNDITIGASKSPRGIDEDSDNPFQVASFSSRGTVDARIKPDLVAPGTWILSTSRIQSSSGENVSSYSYLTGTSMATAVATGAAVLTRQYFTDVKKIQPSAAMVKAAMIHGAMELPGEPREAQGFGLIDLQTTIMALEDGNTKFYNDLKVSKGQQHGFKLSTAQEAPLRATLVWSDPPGKARANYPLVNDLDLKITAPDGRVFWGNHVLGGDRKNNVEVITIRRPVQGEYLIEVIGSNVTQGTQPFSLVFGNLPIRGTIKQSAAHGRHIEMVDGRVVIPDAETPARLMMNNRSSFTTMDKLPLGTKVYYLPAGPSRLEPKLEAVFDMAYASLISRLKFETSIGYMDTPGHWAEDVIKQMSGRKLVGGYPDGTFRPNEQITRAQFAAMLVRALKIVEFPDDAAVFRDVPRNAWYRGAVGAAVSAGLVVGYSERIFGPNDPITREQMAVMLTRAVGAGYIPAVSDDKTLDGYRDINDIALWARPSVSIMVKYDLMKGRTENQFAPQGTTTRAEAATVLLRMFNWL